MAKSCNVDKWTIGVSPVLYRDGQDKMGDHCDDDQGEQCICTLLVESPTESPRQVLIRPLQKLTPRHGDERIELLMLPGDAYVMNGQMQIGYSHFIPNVPSFSNEANAKRIAIVFCTRDTCLFVPPSQVEV